MTKTTQTQAIRTECHVTTQEIRALCEVLAQTIRTRNEEAQKGDPTWADVGSLKHVRDQLRQVCASLYYEADRSEDEAAAKVDRFVRDRLMIGVRI